MAIFIHITKWFFKLYIANSITLQGLKCSKISTIWTMQNN